MPISRVRSATRYARPPVQPDHRKPAGEGREGDEKHEREPARRHLFGRRLARASGTSVAAVEDQGLSLSREAALRMSPVGLWCEPLRKVLTGCCARGKKTRGGRLPSVGSCMMSFTTPTIVPSAIVVGSDGSFPPTGILIFWPMAGAPSRFTNGRGAIVA